MFVFGHDTIRLIIYVRLSNLLFNQARRQVYRTGGAKEGQPILQRGKFSCSQILIPYYINLLNKLLYQTNNLFNKSQS